MAVVPLTITIAFTRLCEVKVQNTCILYLDLKKCYISPKCKNNFHMFVCVTT